MRSISCACLILLALTTCRDNHINPFRITTTSDTILLVLLSFHDNLEKPISNKITSFYHIPVKTIMKPLPASAYYAPRGRYRADSLINYLDRVNAGRYRFVAGLTSVDISCTSNGIKDWGVFGLGSLSAKGCITSSFRLKRNASTALLTERIQKVILHEIGHNHGLPHCRTSDPCFMKDAEGKVSTVDGEPMDVCKKCRRKMKS